MFGLCVMRYAWRGGEVCGTEGVWDTTCTLMSLLVLGMFVHVVMVRSVWHHARI